MSSQPLLREALLGQRSPFPIAPPGLRIEHAEPRKLPEVGIHGLRSSEQELRKPAAPLAGLGERLEQEMVSFHNQNQVVVGELGVFVPRSIFGRHVDIRHELGRMPDGNLSLLVYGVPRQGGRRRTHERTDCREEQQWLERHRAEFAGEWVALDGGRLLSHGADARAVYEVARNLGIAAPLLMKVELPDELPFGGW